MKNRTIIFFGIILFFIILVTFTHTLSNCWLLISTQSNYIPNQSRIWSFQPTQIDEGSGGYWRYGKDNKNYYYFSEDEERVYYFISQKNNCLSFNEYDFKTWCESKKIFKINN